jgi:hypothetical protein
VSKFVFNNVLEHNFFSLEELTNDVVNELKEDKYVTIIVTYDEVIKYLNAFLSTGKIEPALLDWATPEICGYGGEYLLALFPDRGENKLQLYIESAWNDNKEEYYPVEEGEDIIYFVSQDISKKYYDIVNNGKNNIVLYDIG